MCDVFYEQMLEELVKNVGVSKVLREGIFV